MSTFELAEDFEHLADGHHMCGPEEIEHACSCHLDPPCVNCTDCPAYTPEAWVEVNKKEG